MKNIFIIIVLIAQCAAANAFDSMELVYSRVRSTLIWYSKVPALNAAPSLLSIEFEDDKNSIKLRPFDFTSKDNESVRIINLPKMFFLSRLAAFAGKSNIVLAAADVNGPWRLIDYSIDLNKAIKSIALDDASAVFGALSCGGLHFVYGVTNEDYPFILSANIASGSVGSNMLSSTVQGKISDMACGVNGEIISVANYDNGKSGLVIISNGNKVAKTMPVRGGATSFSMTPENKIILTYRKDRDLYVELLDDRLKSLWVNRVLKINGGATRQVVALDNGEFALIGENDGKMFAIHLDEKGKEISVVYNSYSFLPPAGNNYHIFADERGVHVRGIAKDKKGSKVGDYSEVYFLVK